MRRKNINKKKFQLLILLNIFVKWLTRKIDNKLWYNIEYLFLLHFIV